MPEPAQEDKELVKRMLAGEEHAFEEFFGDQFPRLYRFALVRTRQDADAAEEVVQAALCKAISALKSWRGEAGLFTWLCTFCRHEISGYYRRHQAQPQPMGLIEDSPLARASLESLAAQADRGRDDEERRSEVARLVQATLDDLPARYGDALEWKYIHGFSVEEIAARLKVRPKAAESLLTRARQAFREAFTTVTGSRT
ncbi:MAG TPA: RNA polymerase sigma factor [Candidatus Polarisedimenticolia bacterium]|nr:RNA polymerase sigma factor [Candidatus Polarisedimenticolia bacterium]